MTSLMFTWAIFRKKTTHWRTPTNILQNPFVYMISSKTKHIWPANLQFFLCECACVDTKTSIIDDISGGKYSIYIDICGRLATKTVLWELHLFLKKGQFPVSSGTSLILVPVSVLNGTSLILVPVSVLNGTSLILLPVSGPKVSGMTRVMAMVKSVTWSTNTPKAPRAGVNWRAG